MPIKDYINHHSMRLLAPFTPEMLRMSGAVAFFGIALSKKVMPTDAFQVNVKKTLSARKTVSYTCEKFFKIHTFPHIELLSLHEKIASLFDVSPDVIEKVCYQKNSKLSVLFIKSFSEHEKVVQQVDFLNTAKNIDCAYLATAKNSRHIFRVAAKSVDSFCHLLNAQTFSRTFLA